MTPFVKYPQNREVKKRLIRGDTKVLESRTGYTYRTIGVMLNGHRRFPDVLVSEIIKLIEERSELAQKLNQVVKEECAS